MKNSLQHTALSTSRRLFAGIVCLPISMVRARQPDRFPVISVDVFGTLVCRVGDEHMALKASALKTAEIASLRGLNPPGDPVAYRRKIENEIYQKLRATGESCEFDNKLIIEQMLIGLGALDWAREEAGAIAEWEFWREVSWTRPRNELLKWIESRSKGGQRIIAISDTRYTAEELSILFAKHGVKQVSAIYSSVDHRANKFSGRLFDAVLIQEGLKPTQLLHIGDNFLADILSAAQKGISVRWVRRPGKLPELPAGPDERMGKSAANDFGYRTMGPILVGFIRLLFDQAKKDGMNNLAFIARDGYLPFKIAEILSAKSSETKISLKYVHLSRRVTASATYDFLQISIDEGELDRFITHISSMRGEKNLILRTQNYFGFSNELIFDDILRLGCLTGNATELGKFLRDPVVAKKLDAAAKEKKSALFRYLTQESLFSAETAIVDIGWRGTIHEAIIRMGNEKNLPTPKALYLGFWNNESNYLSQMPCLGVLCDQRRGRNLLEGSAWHNAFLLEAICAADHGMVAGYIQTNYPIVDPVHIQSGSAREAELASLQHKRATQDGILAYARWFADHFSVDIVDGEKLRKSVNRKLFKLAFFPNQFQRFFGSQFVHSDPSDDNFATALIMSSGNSFREWFAGIRSPWKGGYFRTNGGIIVASLYCLAEGVISYLSLKQKLTLRRWIFGKSA